MEFVTDYWAFIAGVLGGVVWLVRLEAGMLRNREGIARLEEQRKEDVQDAKAQRDKVDTKLDHISADVNRVLVLLGNKADRQ